ncbi:MAG: hypothetical protein Q4E24_01625 [bacterium]|nr:hypothetical protein [bacterium]
MSRGKDVDYDIVIPALKRIEEAISGIEAKGKELEGKADDAEATLRDNIGKKDAQRVRELAQAIVKATDTGKERIRELIRSYEIERDIAERLEEER